MSSDTKVSLELPTSNPNFRRSDQWITVRYEKKLHVLVLAFLSFALSDPLCPR